MIELSLVGGPRDGHTVPLKFHLPPTTTINVWDALYKGRRYRYQAREPKQVSELTGPIVMDYTGESYENPET